MFELSLLIAHTEGALLRTLGLIERRGFQLAAVSSQPCAQGLKVHVRLSASERPTDVLLRQIRRLTDVRSASLDIARPTFALPTQQDFHSSNLPPIAHRRGLSFLGLPDRVSISQAGVA